MDTMMLKSAIYRKYRTITDFSKAIGWSSSKMSRLLGGRYVPDVVEATAIGTLLDLQTDEFMKIFLRLPSPNVNERKGGGTQ